MREVWLSGLLCSLWCPLGLAGQMSMHFEFRPSLGMRVNTIYEMEGELQFRDLPYVDDTITGYVRSFVSATRRVREDRGNSVVIEVAYDSSFAQQRMRSAGGWLDLPVPFGSLGPFVWLADRRLRVSLMNPPADMWDLNVVRGLRGAVDLELPDSAIAIGQRWPISVPFAFVTRIPSDSALLIAANLPGQGLAVLDSIVDRPGDRLAFVTFQMGLAPTTIAAAYSSGRGDLPVSLSGEIRGSMIWSTGWQAWVAGRQDIEMNHSVVMTTGDTTSSPSMRATMTSRFRIRP